MSTFKQFREVKKALRKQGYTDIRLDHSKHPVVYFTTPSGNDHKVTMSSSPKCSGAINSILKEIRKL